MRNFTRPEGPAPMMATDAEEDIRSPRGENYFLPLVVGQRRPPIPKNLSFYSSFIFLSFFASILASGPLWWPPQSFAFGPESLFWKRFFFVGFAVSLAGFALFHQSFSRRRILAASTVSFFVGMCWVDVNQLQPWAFQYVIMIATLAFSPDPEESFRLIMAGIYCWSGFHKLNPAFAHDVFPNLLAGGAFAPIIPQAALLPLSLLGGYTAGALEILIGVLVLSSHPLATGFSQAMHAFILASVVPSGKLYLAIVPWNIACMILVTLLPKHRKVQDHAWNRVILVVCFIMPALFFCTHWYPVYASWNMFGGNTPRAVFFSSSPGWDDIAMFPNDLQFFWYVRDEFKWWQFDPNKHVHATFLMHSFEYWIATIGAPPAPQQRVYVDMFRKLCQLAGNSPTLGMVIEYQSHWIVPWTFPTETWHCSSFS